MIPLPKDVEDRFYYTIGGIVIRYGFIDAMIADICRILFEDLGGHSSQKKPPTPMSERLKYIGECFRNKQELAHWKDTEADFLDLIKSIDGVRKYIIHGATTKYFPDKNAFQFTKLDQNDTKTGYQQNSITYTQEQLTHFAHACTQVVSCLTDIGFDLEKVATRKKSA